MAYRTLDQVEVAGKVVLTRVDLNVPVEDGAVTDATRIERIVPTVEAILAAGGKPVLLAHFGRPKGERADDASLGVVVPALEAALGRAVRFAEDCVGEPAERAIEGMGDGDVVLLENTRFHSGEEANDPAFAKRLAALGDVYCNDAFSAAHRAHASTDGIAHHLPSCAGLLMAEELTALEAALTDPDRPLAAVVGGSKVSTKLDLLSNLVEKVDILVIGGGMANTFLLAQGYDVGTSLVEREMADTAREIAEKSVGTGCEILLPRDVVVAPELRAGVESKVVPAESCPPDAMILDAGPDSVAHVMQVLDRAAAVIWNGPLGAFEVAPFDRATTEAATHAAELTKAGRLVSVAGGGDTVAALGKAGVAGDFTYVSSAGGAFLEWMEGRTLPGVAALDPSAS